MTDDDVQRHAGFVYVITNRTTGQMYVGRKYTTARKLKVFVPSRWQKYWGSCGILTQDIKRLGHDAFTREIVSVHATRAETNFAEVEEQFTRKVLKAVLSDGSRAYYNRSIMGKFFAPTPESHAKASATLMGHPVTPETRAKLSAAGKGRVMTAETRRKLAEAGKGRVFSAETRAKIGAGHKGKVVSDDARAKMREAGIRRWENMSDEERDRSRVSRPHTEETKAKMSATRKGRKLSEAHKAALSESRRARHLARKALDDATDK